MMSRIFFAALFIMALPASAQLPVEVFGGHQKATLDVMFFRYFKNKAGQNSKLLFFNRNRASIDYRQTSTAYLPQFGFTEAVSWNHPKLKGFAPVGVVQLLNRGTYAKAGVQYAHLSKNFLVFSWAVCELKTQPAVDWFLLTRYEPKLTEKLNLFTQLELVNSLPTAQNGAYSFIQRGRLGLKRQTWQFGAGADFTALGNQTFTTTRNIGAFLRHEF